MKTLPSSLSYLHFCKIAERDTFLKTTQKIKISVTPKRLLVKEGPTQMGPAETSRDMKNKACVADDLLTPAPAACPVVVVGPPRCPSCC